MTKKKHKNKKIELSVILIALFCVVGFVASLYQFSQSIMSKPESTLHLCQGAKHVREHDRAIIEEADLSCMLTDKKNMEVWESSNYIYGSIAVLFLVTLLATLCKGHWLRSKQMSN